MGVNKLTRFCLAAAAQDGVKMEPHEDNALVRVHISKLTDEVIGLCDNSGFFYEYDCDDLMELRTLCMDNRCQTLCFIGDRELFLPLLKSGVHGIDRVVPVGRTMDFDLIWDGYDLPEGLTRSVVC